MGVLELYAWLRSLINYCQRFSFAICFALVITSNLPIFINEPSSLPSASFLSGWDNSISRIVKCSWLFSLNQQWIKSNTLSLLPCEVARYEKIKGQYSTSFRGSKSFETRNLTNWKYFSSDSFNKALKDSALKRWKTSTDSFTYSGRSSILNLSVNRIFVLIIMCRTLLGVEA